VTESDIDSIPLSDRIENELSLITEALLGRPTPDRRAQYYAAQQALAWAANPNAAASPYLTIANGRVPVTGTQADSEDCQACLCQPAS
jgi:hypothetical protein